MDNWETEFGKWIDAVTESVERFFDEIGQTVEEIAQDLETGVVNELESFIREVIEPFIDIEIDINVDIRTRESHPFEDLFSETEFDFNPKIRPSATSYSACINCQHFHGRIYNGTPLICGMHPHGWSDENCPDWEAETEN